MSYALINPDGSVNKTVGGDFPPSTVPTGFKISYHNSTVVKSPIEHSPDFFVKHGTATGHVRESYADSVGTFSLAILGDNLRDVEIVKGKIYEKLGLKTYYSFAITITTLWQRLRWIFTGELPA